MLQYFPNQATAFKENLKFACIKLKGLKMLRPSHAHVFGQGFCLENELSPILTMEVKRLPKII